MSPTPPSASPAPETPTTPPPADRRSLDRALVKGVAWTGLARWGTQIFSWAATLLIARLLTKTDYGLVGYGTLYIGFVQLVNEFGVGAAIVKHRELEGRPVAELGGISLAVASGVLGDSGFSRFGTRSGGMLRVRAIGIDLSLGGHVRDPFCAHGGMGRSESRL